MLPWKLLDTATTPEGGVLRLFQRGTEFSIRLHGGNELMNSRLSGSEEALATLAVERLGRKKPKVLIGGLGMGFTLRALQGVAPDAQIEVAEIVPALVRWAGEHMGTVFGDCLTGVQMRIGDVARIMEAKGASYDAILLDVDNGPDGLTRADNDGLYSEAGLLSARSALTPGGVLAIWSAHPDKRFAKRMESVGFKVEEIGVRAGRKRGARHVIWVGVR